MTKRRKTNYAGRIRVIGGRWRGHWIDVLDEPDLRPTGNRIRETLFNWLMPVIAEARCLDLFAGTGVLGLEAASRGAAEVVLVERDARKAQHLRAVAQRLGADNVTVVCAEALAWLQQPARPFDVVFLDPPFREGWIPRCCSQLADSGWLTAGAFVYIEIEKETVVPQLPVGWVIRREKLAGQVRYLLIQTRVNERGKA